MSPSNSIARRLFKSSYARFFRLSTLPLIRCALLVSIALATQLVVTGSMASAEMLGQNSDILQGNSRPNEFGICFPTGQPCHAEKTVTFTLDKTRYVFVDYDLGQSHGCCADHVNGQMRILVNGAPIQDGRDQVPFFNYGVLPISSFLEDFDFFFPPEVVKGLEPPVSQLDPNRVGPKLTNYVCPPQGECDKKTGRISIGFLDAGSYTVTLQVADAGWNSTFQVFAGNTPIKHLVVIFDENISFDHYFGTYPTETSVFKPLDNTPCVNNLLPNRDANGTPIKGRELCDQMFPHPKDHEDLRTMNRNSRQPFRLPPSRALTLDMNHNYTPEQSAFDGGNMDRFPEETGNSGDRGLVMDYYDGDTVTALWNYAQRYALNDNSYNTNFGPSTVGAMNLVSGQTNGVKKNGICLVGGDRQHPLTIDDGQGSCTMIGDPEPNYDDCAGSNRVEMVGINIGHLLNTAGVTWGWFQGGFMPTKAYDPNTRSNAVCGKQSPVGAALGHNGDLGYRADYSAHHNPFQYYMGTSNQHHVRPANTDEIGQNDPEDKPNDQKVNHQYDLTDFWAAVDAMNMPAVSFLKAPQYQDGHAGLDYSDPLDEQTFLVNTINHLQQSPEWNSTAVIIAYDDSDGWYDHQMSPIVNPSFIAGIDKLKGDGVCDSLDSQSKLQHQLVGPTSNDNPVNGRCGYGPRLPLLIISPWAKPNYVDHTQTDQTSILRFIEDNWLGGMRIGQGSFDQMAGKLEHMFDFTAPEPKNAGLLFLNQSTGQPCPDPSKSCSS